MSKEYTIQKTIALAVTGLSLFLLTPTQFLALFIVLGHGHFVSAYTYQYLGGKITKTYLLFYGLALLVLLVLWLYFESFIVIHLSAALLFLVHFLQDEVTLASESKNMQRYLEVAPAFFLYAILVVESVTAISLLNILLPLTLLVVVAYLYKVVTKKYSTDYLSLSFLFGATLLVMILISDLHVSFEKMIGSIIIFHYVGWYVYYYFKLASAPAARNTYLWRMLIINLAVVLLFAGFALHKDLFGWLFVLFAPIYFYMWTILHILFSYQKWLSIRIF